MLKKNPPPKTNPIRLFSKTTSFSALYIASNTQLVCVWPFMQEYDYILSIYKSKMYYSKHWLIQAGCSSENIMIVEETAAVLHFCLNNKEDGEIKMLDDLYDGKFLVVECEG